MIRRVRLATGLVLFVYVTTHLANLTLGLLSVEAMEAGRSWFLLLWRNPAGTLLLYASLALHLALALWAIYQRRRLRMPAAEAAQLVLGLAVPILLLGHIVGTRGAHELFGTNDTYVYVLLAHWAFDTSYAYQQAAGLLAAWIHGCIGIHFWLRLKPAYGRLLPVLYGAALIVPIVSLLGYAAAGREVLALAGDPVWYREVSAVIQWPDARQVEWLLSAARIAQGAVLALVAGAFAARLARAAVERRRGLVRVTYPGGRVATSVTGPTILDISRRYRIPHASVCGGRGRCSTCRVRVSEGGETLPSPSPEERRVLARVGCPAGVRLACQTRPSRDVSVVPLLPQSATPSDAHPRAAHSEGREKEIAILFADLRSFTQISEKKLPYDVVFVLNRYFAGMGQAVEQAGGRLDKFIGDGVMALFGIETDVETACRQSLEAARRMAGQLAELNRTLAPDLDEPLRIGIGIHAGSAIIGEMGYGAATGMTAVGDAVNTASRLEAMTKTYRAELVVSDDVAARAGVDLAAYPRHQIEVRGRSEPVAIRVVARAAELEAAEPHTEAADGGEPPPAPPSLPPVPFSGL